MILKDIANEILEILDKKRSELDLSFEEDTHTYTMRDLKGNLSTEWPSMSKIMKLFYD